MRSDQPTEIDKLGFEPYVRAVHTLIEKSKSEDLPFAVGVYGPWGSGKSSFMTQLKKALGSKTRSVWFDAWQYDRLQDVRSALIYRILLDLEKTAPEDMKSRLGAVVNSTSRLALASARLSRVELGIGGLKVGFPSPEEVAAATDGARRFQTDVDLFAEEFEAAVGSAIGDGEKLVVFIDDLDRCLPANVLVILEALKLFLSRAPCVFVLGVDKTMVETAIQAHYGVEPGNIGREYLDKLVQLPVELPTVDARALTSHFGPTGLDEIGVKILQVASADNPRLYLRIKSLWDLILPMGEALLLDMDEPMVRHLLLIAISISIRFPALREVSRSRPDGFANFASLCARPTDNSPVYLKTNAPEYLPHWEDANVRTFFSQLRQVLGDDMDPIQKAEIGRLVPILRVAP